jgi:hypothetical protein
MIPTLALHCRAVDQPPRSRSAFSAARVQGEIDRFCGIPVMVSDRLAASSDSPPKYTTLLLKKGSLVFWLGEYDVLSDKDILAHTDVAAYHIYWAVHRYNRHPNGTKSGVVRMYHN